MNTRVSLPIRVLIFTILGIVLGILLQSASPAIAQYCGSQPKYKICDGCENTHEECSCLVISCVGGPSVCESNIYDFSGWGPADYELTEMPCRSIAICSNESGPTCSESWECSVTDWYSSTETMPAYKPTGYFCV